MPVLFLVIFGAGFNRLVGTLAPGVDFVAFMYPGIIAMNVVMSSLMSGASLVWDREYGFLREILVAPLDRTGVVLGKVAGGTVAAVLQAVVLLLIAPIVGVSLRPVAVLTLVPLLVLLSIPVSGLGIFLACRTRSQQGYQMLMQLIMFPMMFLSGIFFPVDSVPPWLAVIAKINPVTYGVDAVRQLLLGSDVVAPGTPMTEGAGIGVTVFGHTMGILENVVVIAVIGVVAMVAATWAFNRQE